MTIDTYEQHEGAFEDWRGKSKTVPTGARPIISDHAMLRFLERACGIEVDAMREQLAGILAPMVGAANVQIVHDGLRFIVRHNVLVTVYEEGKRPIETRRKGRGRR